MSDNEIFDSDIVFPSPDIPVVQLWETPTSYPFKFPFMTRTSKLGKTSVWEIGFDGQMFTNFGSVGDTFRIEKTEVVPKQKKNLIGQALQEMRQAHKLKVEKGYLPLCSEQPRLVVPMKGHPFEIGRIKHWPVYVQIKFDGIRYLVYKILNELQYKSSSNNDVFTLGHLNEAIKLFASLLPNVCTIDGEVYNHSLEFEEIVSAYKKIGPLTETLEYWIFDLDYQSQTSSVYYQDRYKLLNDVYESFLELWYEMYMDDPPIKIVKCEIANSEDEINEKFDKYCDEGYEGVMVKKIYIEGMKKVESDQCLYNRQTRTYGVMKIKKLQDDEAKIVGYSQAKGTQKGCIIFELEMKNGKRFKAVPKWKLERKKEAYENGDSYIGKYATYEYQNLTKNGIPRHPGVKEIRDYE